MSLEIHQFPCRTENYGFLVHDPDSGSTACIVERRYVPFDRQVHFFCWWCRIPAIRPAMQPWGRSTTPDECQFFKGLICLSLGRMD